MSRFSSPSYWCYRCTRFTGASSHRQNSYLFCPDCNGGFIEEIHNPTRLPEYEMSYDDDVYGSGLDRLLDQLTQIEANGLRRIDRNPPALKSAIEALPTINIQEHHLLKDSHCAVCKDPFELQTEATELPCEHLYHSDCILPWLNLRNSCPVCRRELSPENQDSGDDNVEAVGLMIWRLPGGGFAVGSRGWEAEMGGGGGVSGVPVRGLWGGGGGGGGGGFRRVLGGVFCCFGGGGRRRGLSSSSSSSSDDGVSGGSRFIPAIISGSSRQRRASVFDGDD